MLPVRCFTCGHILADLELEFEKFINEYNNNFDLSDEEKSMLKIALINRLLPDKKKYCCRSRLICYIDTIQIII